MAAQTSDHRSILRSLIRPVYVPCFFDELSTSAVLPVLPLYIQHFGASHDLVGAIVAMAGLGALCTGAFAGVAIGKHGERAGMCFGSGVRCASAAACALTASLPAGVAVPVLVGAQLLTGAGTSCFQIARQSFCAVALPNALRGRGNAITGGAARVANVLGPAAGGLLAQHFGPEAAFWAQGAGRALVLCLVVVGVPRTITAATTARASTRTDRIGSEEAAGGSDAEPANRWAPCPARLPPWTRSLLRVAAVGWTFSTVRSARALLVALKASALGLDASHVGFVAATTFACDALIFPFGGLVSDRYGRKASGVPSLLGMAAGLATLAAAQGTSLLLAGAALVGAANGLSAGLIMTLAQDGATQSAPAEARSKFIGAFKVITDSGAFCGPMLVGVVAQAMTLDAAALAIGILATAGAMAWACLGQESLVRHRLELGLEPNKARCKMSQVRGRRQTHVSQGASHARAAFAQLNESSESVTDPGHASESTAEAV
jgi:MFS family permease